MTTLYVAFGQEEKGLVGSKAMVGAIEKSQVDQYCAMIDLDSFSAGRPQVLETLSTTKLTTRTAEVAETLKIPFAKARLDIGFSDAVPFLNRKIPAVTIHGLGNEEVIHSIKDQATAVKPGSVYLGYRLAVALIVNIDKCPCNEFR